MNSQTDDKALEELFEKAKGKHVEKFIYNDGQYIDDVQYISYNYVCCLRMGVLYNLGYGQAQGLRDLSEFPNLRVAFQIATRFCNSSEEKYFFKYQALAFDIAMSIKLKLKKDHLIENKYPLKLDKFNGGGALK